MSLSSRTRFQMLSGSRFIIVMLIHLLIVLICPDTGHTKGSMYAPDHPASCRQNSAVFRRRLFSCCGPAYALSAFAEWFRSPLGQSRQHIAASIAHSFCVK